MVADFAQASFSLYFCKWRFCASQVISFYSSKVMRFDRGSNFMMFGMCLVCQMSN